MGTIQNVILDFDGTVTDVFAKKDEFETKYTRLLADYFEMNVDELRPVFTDIKKEIVKDPMQGWNNNGYIVAPATADPLMLNTVVGFNELVKGLREESVDINYDSEKIPSVEEQDKLGYELFSESYSEFESPFREDAKEFLDALLENYNVKIVTNSSTESVEKQVKALGYNHEIEVIGDARKFEAYPDFDPESFLLPESLYMTFSERPVFLRR